MDLLHTFFRNFRHLHPHRKGNPLLFRSKTKSPQREVFGEVFAEKGLAATCKRSRTVKQRVLGVCSEVVSGVGEEGGEGGIYIKILIITNHDTYL